MDTRTVISGIPFEKLDNLSVSLNDYQLGMLQSANTNSYAKYSFDEIIKWITKLKCIYEVSIKPISIFNISNWKVSESEIRHKDNKYFVIAQK